MAGSATPCWRGQVMTCKSWSPRGGPRAASVRRGRALPAVAAAVVLGLCSWACCPPRLFAVPTPMGGAAPGGLQAGAGASALAGGSEHGTIPRRSRSASAAIVARPAAPAEATTGVRVGVLYIAGQGQELKAAFEKRNVTNATFFQTEVPDAFQMPLAAKLLAMSNTVDVVVAAHGELGEERAEVLRGYQSVALTTNVAVVPYDGKPEGLDGAADTAITMAEIRQQALFGGGPRKSIFFGIGANKTGTPAKGDKKIYF